MNKLTVIACLGNPGKRYCKNRHNIGFIIGDFLSGMAGIAMKKSPYSSIQGSGTMGTRMILLMMPQAYMNGSGRPVKMTLDHFGVDVSKLIVIHDDIELPFGIFRTKFGGGHKGHNGIRSIGDELGTPDFHRLRFGVGRPENPGKEVADYVLSDFTNEEMGIIETILPEIPSAVQSILDSMHE